MHFDTRALVVLGLVVCGKLFGEKGKKASKTFIRREVKKTFRAWKLCMAKDTAHQGCLNLQGIEAVRKVEELEEREEGMLPSKSSIWREGNELLTEVGYPLFKIVHKDMDLGEVVQLDFERLVRFVLEIHGLTELAQRISIELAFSIDAAALTQGTTHIFGALKVVDIRSQNRDGSLMFVKDDDGVLKFVNLQSNKNVYVMIMAYAKDGKAPYCHFLKIDR